MSKALPNSVLDAGLTEIATATQLDVCSDVATPTDLTNSLAHVTLTAGDGLGDYVIGDGDVDGRKIAVAEQADIAIDGAGTQNANHVVLSLAGVIKLVTTCTQQPLTNGGTVTVPTFDYEQADPT